MRKFLALRTRRMISALLVTIALLPGCGAHQLTQSWKDKSFKSTGMQNVLVVALRADVVRRRLWEDSFCKGLTDYGAKATPSYKVWGDAIPDTQQVREVVRRDGYDGVLINTRPPDSQMLTWQPGYTKRESVTEQDPFTGAYRQYWREVEVAGEIKSSDVANFQTDVWTTRERPRLVWSGVSQTTDGVNVDVIDQQTGKLILPELSKSRILGKKAKK